MNAFLPWNYWSRLWIVQETILGRYLRLRYRTLSTTSEWLYEFAKCYQNQFDPMQSDSEKDQVLKSFLQTFSTGSPSTAIYGQLRSLMASQRNEQSRFGAIKLAKHRLGQREKHSFPLGTFNALSFTRAIFLTAAHQSAERQDRIFGMLDLTDSNLKVDYNMPISQLYVRALVEGLLDLHGWKASSEHQSLRDSKRTSDVAVFCMALQDSLGLHMWDPAVLISTVMCPERFSAPRFSALMVSMFVPWLKFTTRSVAVENEKPTSLIFRIVFEIIVGLISMILAIPALPIISLFYVLCETFQTCRYLHAMLRA